MRLGRAAARQMGVAPSAGVVVAVWLRSASGHAPASTRLYWLAYSVALKVSCRPAYPLPSTPIRLMAYDGPRHTLHGEPVGTASIP